MIREDVENIRDAYRDALVQFKMGLSVWGLLFIDDGTGFKVCDDT